MQSSEETEPRESNEPCAEFEKTAAKRKDPRGKPCSPFVAGISPCATEAEAYRLIGALLAKLAPREAL